MIRNKKNFFISIIGVILLIIIFIMPKNLILRTVILDTDNYIDFTNVIFKENNKEININNKYDIDYILNILKEIEVKKINYDIEKENKIELRFFSVNKPKSLNFNIYNYKYIEVISSMDGKFNKNIYEVLQINDLNNIIKEIKERGATNEKC